MMKKGTSTPRNAKAAKSTPEKPLKERKRDSRDIERAVYDGMQDLRAAKRGAPR